MWTDKLKKINLYFYTLLDIGLERLFLRIQLKIEGCDVRLKECLKNY